MDLIVNSMNSEDPLACAASRTFALALGQAGMILAYAFVFWDWSGILQEKIFIRCIIAGDVAYFGLIYLSVKAWSSTKRSAEVE